MRLIDADKAIELFEEAEEDDIELYGVHILECFPAERAEEIVNKAPTIDAVPVIRCKNCKHFAEFRAEAKKDGADGTCRLLIMKVVENEFSSVKATDFCSYGERKE